MIITINCALCGARSKNALCDPCQADLPQLQHPCRCCAHPLPAAYPSHLPCGQCLKHPPSYDRVIALGAYQTPYTLFIPALKFFGNLTYARLMGELLSRHIQTVYPSSALPEAIIPIPLHNKRLRERGFNQALEIAKPLGQQLKLPLLKNTCERKKATKAQLKLPLKQRQRNVKNAFKVVGDLNYQHVAILDDVVTTGNTVDALARELKKAGVKQIDVWCCARAVID